MLRNLLAYLPLMTLTLAALPAGAQKPNAKPQTLPPGIKAVAPQETTPREQIGQFLQDLQQAEPTSLYSMTLDWKIAFRDRPDLRAEAVKAGLLDTTRTILLDKQADALRKKAALDLLQNFTPDQNYLREVVWPYALHDDESNLRPYALQIAARMRYPEAYEQIKAALIEELKAPFSPNNRTYTNYVSLAEALADYGDPEAIPFLIGVIAADNGYHTLYDIGYFALGRKLTGVPFSYSHDGNWWKLWWERNREKMPAKVRLLSVPELPHSADYREPLDRELHLDRAKYRDYLLRQYLAFFQKGKEPHAPQDETVLSQTIECMAELGDLSVVPTLIGGIAADNNYLTVYGSGYFGLARLLGIDWSDLMDGNWWKLWWESHRSELPASVRDLPIPELPHTANYRDPIPTEIHKSPAAMREYLLNILRVSTGPNDGNVTDLGRRLAFVKDPRLVPEVIALMPEDPKDSRLYWLTYFGIGGYTEVEYQAGRGRAWWREWWTKNETDIKKKVYPQYPEQPSYVLHPYRPGKVAKPLPSVTEVGYQPPARAVPAALAAAEDVEENPEDIREVRSERFFAGGDEKKLYRLVGMRPGRPLPAGSRGYKLLVMLPGGDGSDEFRWLARRIKKNALPDDMLIAQLIAPHWNPEQAKNLVWPTRKNTVPDAKFPTEQFIEEVIADAGKRVKLDPAQVYTFAWSSSGPAVYTHLATKGSRVAGAFIAMSVFRPNELPDPTLLKTKRVFLYHSPQDFIPIALARSAEQFLKRQGAAVRFQEYEGGHGWRGNLFGDIRQGIDWLVRRSTPLPSSKRRRLGDTGR